METNCVTAHNGRMPPGNSVVNTCDGTCYAVRTQPYLRLRCTPLASPISRTFMFKGLSGLRPWWECAASSRAPPAEPVRCPGDRVRQSAGFGQSPEGEGAGQGRQDRSDDKTEEIG